MNFTRQKIAKKQIQTFLVKKINQKKIINTNFSFLIVTYNRCPNKNYQNNPLFWSIKSLLKNKLKPNEIMIIDDHSTDYTFLTVEKLKGISNKIKYYKNTSRKGCSFSRNIGLKKCMNQIVIMGDDDCIYKPDFLNICMVSYKYLSSTFGPNKVAIINFPVYEKSLHPKYIISKSRIGRVFLSKTFFIHNFDCFVQEYINKPEYISKTNILKPFAVETFSGINLANKDIINTVGGYPDLSEWTNDYSEHIELSFRIKKSGYKIFHQPDPRSGSIHLKYGGKTQDIFDKRQQNTRFSGIKHHFGDIVKMSEQRIKFTGCRCDNFTFHLNEIGMLFSFYLKISEILAIKFAKKEFLNFVLKNITFSTTPENKINNSHNRYNIWRNSIIKGIKITSQKNKKNYSITKKMILSWGDKCYIKYNSNI